MIEETIVKCLISAAKRGIVDAFTGSDQKDAARFGAAVVTRRGNIYGAGQYFSDTLHLTLHAEQAALAHAAAHGEYDIVAITCVGNVAAYRLSGGKIYPCHLCKQLLWESHLRSGIDTEVIIVDSADSITERLYLCKMMNYPWPIKNI